MRSIFSWCFGSIVVAVGVGCTGLEPIGPTKVSDLESERTTIMGNGERGRGAH